MQNPFPTVTRTVLELDSRRNPVSGSQQALAEALDRGADLLIATGFHHDEHLAPGDPNHELIEEVSDFRVVYRIGREWSAGIMNLRMPSQGPLGFGPRPSWSFFLYNCDGSQAIARPYLDGRTRVPPVGASPFTQPKNMPKYHIISNFDTETNGPCQNFIYDFEYYRFLVRDDWREVYAHDEHGGPVSGSLTEMVDALRAGCEIKAAIRNFRRAEGESDYELFTCLGSSYYSTGSGHLAINSQPLVLVRPNVPLRYTSGNWTPGNMLLHNTGRVEFWSYDPYTMEYAKSAESCAIRYFAR